MTEEPQGNAAVAGQLERGVRRLVPERADACAQGCDDCTDYEDDDCSYCRGSGTDRYTDNLLTCPYCDGSGLA
jgi:hypothetical protein